MGSSNRCVTCIYLLYLFICFMYISDFFINILYFPKCSTTLFFGTLYRYKFTPQLIVSNTVKSPTNAGTMWIKLVPQITI